ncbi:MAG: glycerophosphodiester phosphodiesterase, partial [Myxococcales bacterium]
MALAPENSLQAFGNALSIGVTTLELDVHISVDGAPVVTHDRVLPDGEYVAWTAREHLPFCTLDEVFALCDQRGADDVRFNIETKFDAIHPDEGSPRERFAEVVARTVDAAGTAGRCSIQSFDWACLDLVADADPRLGLNVLTNVAYWEVGEVGPSPWMAGVDIDDFGGSVVAAAAGRGYDALSPAFALVTRSFVADAHTAGLKVIPYTVNEVADLERCVDLGCDGFITNHPDRARDVLASRGITLP